MFSCISFGIDLVGVEITEYFRDDLASLFVRGGDQGEFLLKWYDQSPV